MLEFAKTPPKGWNSWDVYGASVTEEEVKRNADIMAEKLKKYGWNYVVVDIQWYEPGAESAAYRKFAEVGGQAVLGRQFVSATPWLTERHGYDPT